MYRMVEMCCIAKADSAKVVFLLLVVDVSAEQYVRKLFE